MLLHLLGSVVCTSGNGNVAAIVGGIMGVTVAVLLTIIVILMCCLFSYKKGNFSEISQYSYVCSYVEYYMHTISTKACVCLSPTSYSIIRTHANKLITVQKQCQVTGYI